MPSVINPTSYNGTFLQSIEGVTVLATNPYKIPKRDLSMSTIVRTSKSAVNSGFWSERDIEVRVSISRATRELMQDSLDQLMSVLQPLNKELIVNQGSGQRKYYCSLADAPVDKDGGSYQELTLVFSCSDRYGYATTTTTVFTIGTTTAGTRSDAITLGGSAEWQTPVITISFSALTGGTSKTVTVGNNGTGQAVSVLRTWTAGDILVIDSYNKTVKVNGVAVAFTGAIPEWKTGAGVWYEVDDLTTRTYTGTITNVNKYL